jgi:coatomer protein complex subunit alpha (xenin)
MVHVGTGHDSGLLVFKLQRERPAFDTGKRMVYYKDLFLYEYDFKTDKEKPILSTRRRTTGPGAGSASSAAANANAPAPRTLLYNSFNQTQHCILLCSDAPDTNEKERAAEEGSYELYVFPKGEVISRDDAHSALRGFAKSAVFVSRNRFAVLDKSKQVMSC